MALRQLGQRAAWASSPRHVPVLLKPMLQILQTSVPSHGSGLVVDATLGAGGYTRAILAAAPTGVRVLGLDADSSCVTADAAAGIMADVGTGDADNQRLSLRHACFADVADLVPAGSVDVLVADLGVSSMQLDTPERGFSWRHCGGDTPLDMRMDQQSNAATAADLVNAASADQLSDILYRYGEERRARDIARAIVASRPIETTGQLAQIVQRVMQHAPTRGSRGRRIHPATRTFQALRIAVNDELGQLERLLTAAETVLRRPGGTLIVVSFHSLEDRIVKQALRRTDVWSEVTRRPIRPDVSELEANPRSVSGRLRAARLCGAAQV